MKKPKSLRSLVVGACAVAIMAAFTSYAVAVTAPPIPQGATPPPGTESFMVAPCTTCHTYVTTTPPGGTTTTTTPTPAPVRICGNCHKDPGPGVVAPREEHPFLYGGTTSGERENEHATVKKHHHKKAKKHARKARRVARED